MKWKKIISAKSVLLVLLLAAAVMAVPVSADTDVNGPFTPPNGRILVNTEIDNVLPDPETAESFIFSPTADLVIKCLWNKDRMSELPYETLSTILTDFEYYDSNGEITIRNISVAELLSDMNTTFSVWGWCDYIDTHQYITCSVDTERYGSIWINDLKNTFNFIQAMAKRDGFEKTIPIVFSNIQLTGNHGINQKKIALNESILRAKTDRTRPLIGGIASKGVVNLPYGIGYTESTLGFSVKLSDGRYGIISCGHSKPEGTVMYQPFTTSSSDLIGTVSKRYLDGVDAALIICNPTIQSKGSINGQPWNPGSEVIDVNSYGRFDGSKKFKLSGVISGNLANLDIYGVLPQYTFPTTSAAWEYQAVTLNEVLLIKGTTSDGDSGAPVYQNYDGILPDWNNKLVGIVSGTGTADGVNVIYIQQIPELLARFSNDGYSLTVLTNGNT